MSRIERVHAWPSLARLRGACVAALLLCAGCAPALDTAGTAVAALSSTPPDTSAECVGILSYATSASQAALDAYLPSQVAAAIVARRATSPFISMADLSSVSGVAQARLAQIAQAARTQGSIGPQCEGVWEENAVSTADRIALLAFVNGATQAQLLAATRGNEDVVPHLLAARPYANLDALSATPQVGPWTFEALRAAAACGGSGCTIPVAQCLFGTNFGAIDESSHVTVALQSTFDGAADFSGFSLLASQFVNAVRVSGRPEVGSVEQALAACTDHFAERYELYDSSGARSFTAWRFVLGDHYFGAIYAQGTTSLVSLIVDNELDECTVGVEQCMLGSSYSAFTTGSALETLSTETITSATGLSAARSAQLVRAVQEAFTSVSTAAGALAAVQDGTVNVVTRRDIATSRTFVAYEYGAGDNSYGAVFEGTTSTPAAVIHDGDLYGCSVFRP